jgi:hypothetical protein
MVILGYAVTGRSCTKLFVRNGVRRGCCWHRVFPGEACEELGGDFCEPEFQEGVFPEKTSAKK